MIDFSSLTQNHAAVLLCDPETRRYFTGVHSSDGYVLVTANKSVLLVDSRYYEAAKKHETKQCEVALWSGSACTIINDCLQRLSVKRLYVDDTVSVAFYKKLCGEISCEVTSDASVGKAIDIGRSVKSEREIELTVRAQKIAEKAYLNLLSVLKPGMTERQVALQLDYEMRSLGSEGVAFDTIAVSGTHSSLPHGEPTDKPLENGDFLTLDFGAVYEGYHSDTTRTVAIGYATDDMRRVYDVVLTAQLAGCEALRAGMTGQDADGVCRQIIETAGYGDYFGHATGHGVGLAIHEYPSLSPKNTEKLRENQLVTIEPGIYLPGRFGVRIEDLLVVGSISSHNLTNLSKTLIILS